MESKQTISTKKLVLTGLMAALVLLGSWLRITLPVDLAGTTSFHLGNIFCALSGILLGPWLGGLAAGLGSAIFDILNPLYISECWLTFITKGLYGLAAGLVVYKCKGSVSYGRAVLASIAGAVTYAIVYLAKSYFYTGLLIHGLPPQAALVSLAGKLPATIFNAVIAVICAPALAVAIRKALGQGKLRLN